MYSGIIINLEDIRKILPPIKLEDINEIPLLDLKLRIEGTPHIPRKIWRKIQVGEYVVFRNGRTRKVLSKNAGYLTFKKINGDSGETAYCYSDICRKVLSILAVSDNQMTTTIWVYKK